MMNKIFYFSFIFLSFFFFSCQTNVDGHWHLYDSDGKTHFLSTIDFEDSIVYINKNNTMKSMFFSKDATNNVLVEMGGIEILEYKINGNNLILNSRNNSRLKNIHGIRKAHKCDLEIDIFAFDNIDIHNISLPKTSLSKQKLSLRELIVLELIIHSEKTGDSSNTLIYSRKDYDYIKLDNINKIVDKRSENLPVKYQDKGNIVLYVDKYLKMSEFNTIIKNLKLCKKDIYLAIITDTVKSNTEELTFIKFDINVIHKENQNFNEWVEIEFTNNLEEN